MLTEETKKKMSESKKGILNWNFGRNLSEATKEKIRSKALGNQRRLGAKLSDESKRKIGIKHKGKILSQETRNKISMSLVGKPSWNKGKKTPIEVCKKISLSLMGRVVSEETIRKISISNKGKHQHNLGKKLSCETCKKISIANKGRPKSEEHKRKLSLANKGKKLSDIVRKNISEGHKNPSAETRLRMSNATKGEKNFWFGKKISDERKKKISEANKGRPSKIKGDKHPFWKGGITPLNTVIRKCPKYIEWRTTIFKRDDWTCLHCLVRGEKGSRIVLNVDHIKPFALIRKENNINTIEDAINCNELWDTANGRTLCFNCHLKLETHGRKVNI